MTDETVATDAKRHEPVKIALLGPMQVSIGTGSLGPIRNRKVLWLLGLLVIRSGRPTSRKRLAATLWPDKEQSAALASLRPALSELRRALGEASWRLLSPDRDTVAFDVEGADIDLLKFERAVAKGDPESLEQAVSLYRGPLLESCSEEWVFQERLVQEQACIQALLSMGGHHLTCDAPDKAAIYYQRAIGLDPWRDAPRRGLMQAYANTQDINSALQVYREFARDLSSEGGLEPDAQTVELYQRLRSEARTDARAKPRLSVEAVSSLPHSITPLIGRDDERLEVAARLRRSRLVTLTGVGGIGKTRLALGASTDLQSEYGGRVWFVPLDSVLEGGSVPFAVATALSLREESSDALIAKIAERLGPTRCLLILDNCEHLLDATAELAARLLRDCPELRVLATSREAMGVPGEIVWPVPALAFPLPTNLPDGRATRRRVALGYESVGLFVDRAQAVQPPFTLTDENVGAVIEICSLVEGIPLAIEMAAAGLRSMGATEIAGRLRDQLFDALQYRRRGTPARQETLEATLGWSYDLLSETEKRMLEKLSIFVGGWTLQAAESVAGDDSAAPRVVHDSLRSLVDKSLVVFDPSDERYRMLEVVRQYAARKLKTDDRAESKARHLDWCAHLAQTFQEEILGPNQTAWLERVDCEWPNIRAAIVQGHEAPDLALQLAASLWQYWYRRSMLEGRERLQEALDRAPHAPSELRASALFGLGCLFYNEGDFGRAKALLVDCLRLREAAASPSDLARTLDALGNCASAVDDYGDAEEYYSRSIAVRRTLADETGVARSLMKLADVMFCVADYPAARRLNDESVSILERAGDRYSVLWLNISLVQIDIREGNSSEAREKCRETMDLARELGDPQAIAWCHRWFGTISHDKGDFESAKASLSECLDLFRDSGHRRAAACCAVALGQALRGLGDPTSARRLQEESVRTLRELGDRVSTAEGLHALGCTLDGLGDQEAAEGFWRQSLQIRADVGEPRGAADCLDSLAMRSSQAGNDLRAALLFGSSEALREKIGSPIPPVDRAAYETHRGRTQARLGSAGFESAHAQGRALSWLDASQCALSE